MPLSVTPIATINGTVEGELLVDAAGNVYGLADNLAGGNGAEVFEVAAGSGTATSLGTIAYDTTGAGLTGGLAADAAGNLYGTTDYGPGNSGSGTVFMVDAVTHALHERAYLASGQTNGPPVADAAGDVFFIEGGSAVIELAAGSQTPVTVASVVDAAGLSIDAAGNLYGTTGDGAHGYGSVFEIAAGTSTVTSLVDFDASNGDGPVGHLVQDAAGNLYGNAHNLFEIAAGTHKFTVLATFADGGTSESYQIAVTAAGTIYGTTSGGDLYELATGSQTVETLGPAGVGDLTIGADGTLYGAAGGTIEAIVPCYALGTLVLTDRGEIAVERLAIDDRLVTASGAVRRVRWIGRRSYAGRFANGNRDVLPICFKAGSLGDHMPRRDLWVSPKHAMFLDGVLIPAEHLVNGVSVIQAERVDRVDYFHIELDSHDLIVVEGALSETFVDDHGRALFHNANEFRTLYPDAGPVEAIYCAPRVEHGFELEAVRRRIAERAGLAVQPDPAAGALRGFLERVGEGRVRGWAQSEGCPDAPVCLDVLVDGIVVAQVVAGTFRRDLLVAGIGDGCHAFEAQVAAVPAGAVSVRRSADHAALRRLPVAAQGLTLAA